MSRNQSLSSGGYPILETKEPGRDFLTWQWLGGLCISLLIMAGGFVLSTVQTKIADQQAQIVTILSAQQQAILRENNFNNSLDRVKEAQDREHRLLLQIAKKMGIEVAE